MDAVRSPVATPDGGQQDCGPDVRWLRQVLGTAVVGPHRQHLGHVRDLVVRSVAGPTGNLVIGLVVDVGGHRRVVPAAAVRRWGRTAVEVRDMVAGPPGAECDGDDAGVLLRRSVLGQPVLTALPGTRARRVSDIGLRPTGAGWVACAVDTRTRWQRLCRRPRRLTGWRDLLRRHHMVAPPHAAPTGSAQRGGGARSPATAARWPGHRRSDHLVDGSAQTPRG